MANQKMSELAIINTESLSNGAVKRPNAVNLAAMASGQSLESLLPVFTFQGYSLRVLFYSPAKISILVFDKTETKDKVKTTTDVMQLVDLVQHEKFRTWQANSLFDSKQAAKLAPHIAKKLWDYPLLSMGDAGLYPKENVLPTLSAIINTKYGLDVVVCEAISKAMLAYTVNRPALYTSPLSKICGFVETEHIKQIRQSEHDKKQAKKQLASATAQDDKF